MEKDKLIAEALKKQTSAKLPADFNAILMNKIQADVAKRNKQQTFLNYLLVSFVSLSLVGLTSFLLKDYWKIFYLDNIKNLFSNIYTSSILPISIAIAGIIIFLLISDRYMRILWEKHTLKKCM